MKSLTVALSVLFASSGFSQWDTVQDFNHIQRLEKQGENTHFSIENSYSPNPFKSYQTLVSHRNLSIPTYDLVSEAALSLQFKVSSVGCGANYAVIKLPRQLFPDSVYKFQFALKQGRNSLVLPKHIHSVFINDTTGVAKRFIYQVSQLNENKVQFHTIQDLSRNFSEYSFTYQAEGYERFLIVGNLGERYSIKEANELGLLWVDQYLKTNKFSAEMVIDDIVMQSVKEEDSNLTIDSSNIIFGKMEPHNLMCNSGLEMLPNKQPEEPFYLQNYRANYWYTTGVENYVINKDEDDRGYDKINNYTGNGSFYFTAIKSNVHHSFRKVVEKRSFDHTPVMEINIYEDTTYNPVIYNYKSSLTNRLKKDLEKDKVYHLEWLASLDRKCAYGAKYFGIWLTDSFPSKTDLEKATPNSIVDVSILAHNVGWQKIETDLVATCDAKFLTIMPVEFKGNFITSNVNLQREVRDICDPNNYSNYCYHKVITYKDSLFAKYTFDHFLLLPKEIAHNASAEAFSKSINIQIVATGFYKKNKEDEELLEAYKNHLNLLPKILRATDEVAISDLGRGVPLQMSPELVINKKKILRNIGNLKTGKVKFQSPEYLSQNIFIQPSTKTERNILILLVGSSLASSDITEHMTAFHSQIDYIILTPDVNLLNELTDN